MEYKEFVEYIKMNAGYIAGEGGNITINHVNTDEISEDDFTKLEKTDSAFADFGTPFLVVAADGKLIDKVNGLTNTAGYLEFFQKNGFISE